MASTSGHMRHIHPVARPSSARGFCDVTCEEPIENRKVIATRRIAFLFVVERTAEYFSYTRFYGRHRNIMTLILEGKFLFLDDCTLSLWNNTEWKFLLQPWSCFHIFRKKKYKRTWQALWNTLSGYVANTQPATLYGKGIGKCLDARLRRQVRTAMCVLCVCTKRYIKVKIIIPLQSRTMVEEEGGIGMDAM